MAEIATQQHALTVTVGEFLFEFDNHSEWRNKAASWFRKLKVSSDDVICVDSAGRICLCGKQFSRAATEGTFPIKVYMAVVD